MACRQQTPASEQIAQMTETNGAAVDQIFQSVKQLETLAGELKASVEQFKALHLTHQDAMLRQKNQWHQNFCYRKSVKSQDQMQHRTVGLLIVRGQSGDRA